MICWCNDPTVTGSDAPSPHEVGSDGCVFDDEAALDRISSELAAAPLTWLESLVGRFPPSKDLTGWIVA